MVLGGSVEPATKIVCKEVSRHEQERGIGQRFFHLSQSRPE
jgi:hypothetical protein